MNRIKKILVAPLDWGLGHATRCMPIIDLLLEKKYNVVIAGNGDSFYLLKENYPSLTFYELPGYNISYASGKNASFQALLQTPKIIQTIWKEKKVVEMICAKEKIDLIISDNRYGVRKKNVKSIFICHQIALQSPSGFQFMNPIFLNLHLQQINKFDALWIPDVATKDNLSGILSHGINIKIPHTFIGILSRFSTYKKVVSIVDKIEISILVVLSGPEPQRTFLETELKKKLSPIEEKIIFVQGKTEQFIMTVENNITTFSYLNSNDLFAALQKAETIICRSGYSTIMDLATLGKKAILIPAEGQTEQEYLAKLHVQKGNAIACQQHELNIEDAIEQLKNSTGFPKVFSNNEIIEKAIEKYLSI